jgi:hypothetical protein
LTGITEAGPHDLGTDSEVFVIVEDTLDRGNARIICSAIVFIAPITAKFCFMPVGDAPYKRGNQFRIDCTASRRLYQREEQRHIAMNAFRL